MNDLKNQLCVCCGKYKSYHMDESPRILESGMEWNNSSASLNGTDFTSVNSSSSLNFLTGGRRSPRHIPSLYQNGFPINGHGHKSGNYAFSYNSNGVHDGVVAGSNNFILKSRSKVDLESNTKVRFNFSNDGFYLGEQTTRNSDAYL